MSNARNISKADSRFVNATGDTISGIVNNESKVGIKVGSSPDTNLEVATRYSYNYAENMAIKVKNSESNYNNHMYLGSIGSSMITDGARYYGGGAFLFEDAEASMIKMNNGATSFHARTGATVGGSSYSFPKVMGIDNAGRVTMPNQPTFDVAYSGSGYSTLGTVVFDTIYGNVGGHYSTSTGRFTAPVSGSYLFYTTYIKNNDTTTGRRRFEKNGVQYGGGRHLRLDDGQQFGDNGVLQAIIYLNAGDFVSVNQFAGSSYGTNEYDYFGGYLIG